MTPPHSQQLRMMVTTCGCRRHKKMSGPTRKSSARKLTKTKTLYQGKVVPLHLFGNSSGTGSLTKDRPAISAKMCSRAPTAYIISKVTVPKSTPKALVHDIMLVMPTDQPHRFYESSFSYTTNSRCCFFSHYTICEEAAGIQRLNQAQLRTVLLKI